MLHKISIAFLIFHIVVGGYAFSVENARNSLNRRSFFSNVASVSIVPVVTAASFGVGGGGMILPATAASPEIFNLKSGIKYAITKPSEKGQYPQVGDIVAIEYTGYLTNGQIFDATHSEGKKNALLFKLGSTAVIPGLTEIVANMRVGEKVQAIIPPNMAFGDEGVCLENGECLIQPGATLVYDVLLKKTSIPPP